MIAVIQRVRSAEVCVQAQTVGKIGRGFLVLLGVEAGDNCKEAEVLSAKVAGLRIFEDAEGKMNLAPADVTAGMLVISNFTLCADCKKGRRPNFMRAALPDAANELYTYFCECLRKNGIEDVQRGIFGADMQVSLCNDGPVTIILDSKELAR
ncbi:MAG TPA: D-tyrosyl-tRNA(Tyr) deacylase [Candidatus Scatavimonas merdigallinarum]|uniref:D-aminoacyl-tRNA deacylase n=1 Tax=Candidatus Scatavimonas merdigallinarum TaxID=2840914 RepID=A0A9D1CTR9_9FIRM|nr:D-tyrosyl-tRNA(Tyr) deacylase [Candidatus Scatavimonas merdigallinarum]